MSKELEIPKILILHTFIKTKQDLDTNIELKEKL